MLRRNIIGRCDDYGSQDSDGCSRRAFIATAALALSSPQTANCVAGGPGDTVNSTDFERKRKALLAFVHPDAFIDRRQIPADKNAYGPLCEAGKKLTAYSDFAARYCQQHEIDILDEELFDQIIRADDSDRYPTGQAAECLEGWLNAHAFVPELVEQSLQRRELQLSHEDIFEFIGKDFEAFDLMSAGLVHV